MVHRAAEQGLGNARVQRDLLREQLSPAQLEEARAVLDDVERARVEAEHAAERLRNFHAGETIIASQLLSVDELNITEMNDGTSLVYIRYVMQRLQRGEGDPEIKEVSKWFKVRRGDDGFEMVDE
ncbi:MAG: hypothetical protein ABR544_10505 [Gammaproteobacteria bacterium]